MVAAKGEYSSEVPYEYKIIDYTAVVANLTSMGLAGQIVMELDYIGNMFLTIKMNLTGPVGNFGTGTNNMVYF